jgi:PPIC-type PPIASE domain
MTPHSRRAWLIGGALTGCALAAIQILHDVRIPVRLLPNVAARVNGREIDEASVDRTVASFDAPLRGPGSYARERVVLRMIDEELLVQHALDSGTAETDPEVRAALVRAVITRVNSEVAAQTLSEEEIEAFYKAHRIAYASPVSYEVTPLYFESSAFPSVQEAQRRAAEARAGIHAGQTVETLRRGADPLPFAPPAQLMTARTLANYFGSPLVDGLDHVPVGETTQPANFGRGVLLLYLNRRVDSETPNLGSIRELVQADAMRERQEIALEKLLGSLRKAARIDIASTPPDVSSH